MKSKKKEFKNFSMQEKITEWFYFSQELEQAGINIGIDKIKLCYRITDGSVLYDIEKYDDDDVRLESFRLHRINNMYYSHTYIIIVDNVTLGKVYWNNKHTIKQAWISIDNKALYTSVIDITLFSQELGLAFNNVTELELFIDVNSKNRLKKLIRNDKLTMYLNGRKVKDRHKPRTEIIYMQSGDVNGGNCNETLYIYSQNALKEKITGITISTYDKLKECKNNKKDYILEKYNNPEQLYRTEIRVGNREFKNYLAANNIVIDERMFLSSGNKGFLFYTFNYFFDKVIRFKKGKEFLDILDII